MTQLQDWSDFISWVTGRASPTNELGIPKPYQPGQYPGGWTNTSDQPATGETQPSSRYPGGWTNPTDATWDNPPVGYGRPKDPHARAVPPTRVRSVVDKTTVGEYNTHGRSSRVDYKGPSQHTVNHNNNVNVRTMVVQAKNPKELMEGIERETRVKNLRRGANVSV